MMAAYGEGFELLAGSQFDLDLHQVAGALEPRLRRALVAARPGRARVRARPAARVDPRLRRGLRRGPLDGAGGARPGRAAADHHAVADAPLRVAAAVVVQREGAGGAAQRVRRPRRASRRTSDSHDDAHARRTRSAPGMRLPAHARSVRGRRLRRDGRPHGAQAHAGALQPRARAAAAVAASPSSASRAATGPTSSSAPR